MGGAEGARRRVRTMVAILFTCDVCSHREERHVWSRARVRCHLCGGDGARAFLRKLESFR